MKGHKKMCVKKISSNLESLGNVPEGVVVGEF